MTEKPNALEVQALAAEQATLDEFMRRDPATLTLEDRKAGVELLRRVRPRFIKAEADRKAKKREKADD